jgi:hypothetical protein
MQGVVDVLLDFTIILADEYGNEHDATSTITGTDLTVINFAAPTAYYNHAKPRDPQISSSSVYYTDPFVLLGHCY